MILRQKFEELGKPQQYLRIFSQLEIKTNRKTRIRNRLEKMYEIFFLKMNYCQSVF